jgi:hypothetical protein
VRTRAPKRSKRAATEGPKQRDGNCRGVCRMHGRADARRPPTLGTRVPTVVCERSLRTLLVLLFVASAFAATPLHVFEGNGLTLRVFSISQGEETVTGDVTSRNVTYPFTARLTADGDVALYQGTFRDGDETVAFSATQREGADLVTFVLRGRQFRLREVSPARAAAPPAPTPPPTAPADRPPPTTAPRGGTQAASPDLEQVKLRKVEFRDITMGGVVAYTMLVPDGWKVDGHVEWSNERTPYPQNKIKVIAPDLSWISFVPAAKIEWWEGAVGRGGEPPPRDLGAWIVSHVARTNKEVRDVRLVGDERDPSGEAAMAALARQTGAPLQGTWEKHVVTFTFVMNGVPFTEEIRVTYTASPPTRTQNMTFGFWMLFVDSDVRAPTARWERMKPLLLASAGSLRTVPEWFTQQQAVLMEITRRNHVMGMEEIRRRGEHYSRISDENFAAWKRTVAISDKQQNDHINAIREVDDFRDTDGNPVKLPIHYKHYYSDGKGNYVMTNSTHDAPGSGWTQLQPMD